MAIKIYEIADGVSITSKGVILPEGQEVTSENFVSEDVFNTLVKTKKIVEVTKNDGASENKKKEKKEEKKGKEEVTSSTGAAELVPENTTPNGAA